MHIVDKIINNYQTNNNLYIGEKVTTSDHMLQTAMLAEKNHSSKSLICACLLHDYGHFVIEDPDLLVLKSLDGKHENVGFDFLKDYLSIIIFLFVAFGLSAGFIILNFLFSPKNPDPEKLSAYECGFEAFGDSRMEFDVRFYLVAILFIIFDLEIAFLFPWAISLGNIGALGFWSMMIFLFILTIGFVYEWKKGALDWD